MEILCFLAYTQGILIVSSFNKTSFLELKLEEKKKTHNLLDLKDNTKINNYLDLTEFYYFYTFITQLPHLNSLLWFVS